jgi:multidrug efflux pump subunit AcrA (membrane-fusion protein)
MNPLTPLFGLTTLVSLPLLASPTFQEPEQEPAAEIEIVALGSGTVVPTAGTQLMPWPRAYSGQMILLEVAEHGSWVEKGQPIARVDRRSLVRQLRDAELRVESAESDLKMAHDRAEMLRDSTEWGLHRKELALKRAHQELESWVEFELGQAETQKLLSAMYREHGLEDALDELRQLEAMYTDDELTDATEEIVLKRQRRNLERSRISAGLQEAQSEHNAATQWERTGMQREMAVREAEMELEHAERNAKMSMHSTERGLVSSERSLRDAKQLLEDLRGDAKQLELRAPERGMLLHGSIEDAGSKRHRMGGQLSARQAAFMVYQPGAYELRMKLSAADKGKVTNGQNVSVAVDGSELKLTGRLMIDAFPGPGGYAARVVLDGEQAQLVPGATASVSFRAGN